MPAIVTDSLKTLLARNFYDQFANASVRYYIGIGRSEQWDSADAVPTPRNTPDQLDAVRNQMQSVKKVQATSLVVPRHNWSNGQIYSQFDNRQQGYPVNPYYVINENNNVYICLETGRNNYGVAVPSTIEPTGANNDSFRTADGYVWKFLFTVSASRANSFMSSNFMPVQKQGATDSSSTGIQLKQEEIQDNAVAGMITSLILTDGGVGYTSIPSVTIIGAGGLGSGAVARAWIDSTLGTVSKISLLDSGAGLVTHGSGYNRPSVILNGGGASVDAKARAVLGSDSGIGADCRVDLKSSSIMFHTQVQGTDSNFIINQDFRQVSLIKDIRDQLGAVFTGLTGNTLKSMTMGTVINSFTVDKKIRGTTTLAEAFIDNIDSNILYYHQTDSTGFTSFQDGEIIEEINGIGDGICDSALILPNVDPATGDILYIDNRAPILRSNIQSEDIKVIIQF